MSKVYAAQYRDMADAIHYLMVYDHPAPARAALDLMRMLATMPVPAVGTPLEYMPINFRNPPTTWKGRPLEIVNDSRRGVPDVWPYSEGDD